MTIAISAAVQATSEANSSERKRRFGRLLGSLRDYCCPPNVGAQPIDLYVSRRGWKRNSAFLMSLQEARQESGG